MRKICYSAAFMQIKWKNELKIHHKGPQIGSIILNNIKKIYGIFINK